MTHYYGIIAAAGLGKRFGGRKPKQYEMLGEQTMLEHSIKALLDCDTIEKIMVALHPKDTHWQTLSISKHPKILTTPGGTTRANSVKNALEVLANLTHPKDFILIHDAARPFVPKQDILKLIRATKNHDIGGILAAPVVDTIKYSQDGKHIEKTIPRENLYRALTPQCFRYEKLLNALAQTTDAADDAMALEYAGFNPLLVLGNSRNTKITFREDF